MESLCATIMSNPSGALFAIRDIVFEAPLTSFLTLVGLSVVLSLFFQFLGFLCSSFFRGGKNLKALGEWAVVTGATDGIGKAIAKRLAKKGLKVVLISRTMEKLEAVAKEIKDKYNTETKCIAANFGSDEKDMYARIASEMSGLDVGVLVNNVGVSYDHAEYLAEVPQELIERMIRVNCDATTYMTRIVLPGMVNKKKGAIVSIGSAAGQVPADPLYTVYAASKAYVDAFSRSLNAEYGPLGITAQCQIPLYVVSKLAKIRKPSFFVPTPDNYAVAAVNSIGYESSVVPYWTHKIQMWAIAVLPASIFEKIKRNMGISIRKRALKKKELKKD
uniref:Uncharacterized protein n=1 Tax=Palpitomonas bilix TaxID=652834 RepID=A0A7S3DDU8_9EUKA|mmetsp:Transcript_32672/g.84343  ORF Transcript_32672/g.84343 Transcript_32672/m.84343 type:complete len:332 (+) Transcript_32672:65-1060(+)